MPGGSGAFTFLPEFFHAHHQVLQTRYDLNLLFKDLVFFKMAIIKCYKDPACEVCCYWRRAALQTPAHARWSQGAVGDLSAAAALS